MEKKTVFGGERRAAAEAGDIAEIQSDRSARRRTRESHLSALGT